MRINTVCKAGVIATAGLMSALLLSGCQLVGGDLGGIMGTQTPTATEENGNGGTSEETTGNSGDNGLFGLGSLFGNGSSKNTSEGDRANYSTVQDTKGNEYVTVIHAVPSDGTDFDVEEFEQLLSDSSISWYQLIAGNNMGTGTQEEGYLYFTNDITYTELSNYAQILANDGYTTSLMSPDEYGEYEDTMNNSSDFYYNEVTYYGPAAKTE